jgi:hypothetical protein
VAFRTLSVELVEYGERAVPHFRGLGFVVRIEPMDIGFPSTPALTCRRPQTTIALHVMSTMNDALIDDWCGYARSAGRDVRIAVLVPAASWAEFSPAARDRLFTAGVGVFVAHKETIEEVSEPQDISVDVTLPLLARMPAAHRQLLGPAYEHFRHRRWREGFDEACRAVESQARVYLADGIRSTRIQVVSDLGKDITPTLPRVRRMTLGALAQTFKQIKAQTLSDSLIGKTLQSINPDRIGRAHGKRTVERRLRLNVGRHMHAIVTAVKHLLP